MSLINANTNEEVQKEFDEINDYMVQEEKQFTTSSWTISILTHAIILLIIGTIVISSKLIKDEVPIQHSYVELPKTKPPENNRKLIEVEKDYTVTEVEDDKEVLLTELYLPDEPDITTEEPINEQDAMGREDAVSTNEMASTYALAAIGSGGGAPGKFGRRKGGDRNRGRKGYGKNARAATSALDAALKWLVRHQSPNGMWDSDAYFGNCQEGNQMEAGKSVNGADEALTGYALLCFGAMGYDHKHLSRYRKTVKRGIEWLLMVQQDSGLIGSRNYEHAVCTMALAEAYGMSGDKELKMPAQKAVNIILDRQTKIDGYGYGWDYIEPNVSRQDNSVTPWNIMALKSAKASGLNIGNGLQGSKRWLEGAWKATNSNWKELDPYQKSLFPYTWDIKTNKTKKDHMSFSGSLCAVFLGYNAGDIILETLANDMTERWFDTEKYKTNSYALYYSSLSSMMLGGKHWKEKWGNEDSGYVPWLIITQYKTGDCYDGTWPRDQENFHGHDTSPVLIHTYKTLSLSVAYRYLPLSLK